ncbi:MAG TPA: hypothetical protein EYP53_01660 [Candidatus Latescibacteria bacterium]|nr:hypothetical protein [Candidatus Latescibacterota bacterium]
MDNNLNQTAKALKAKGRTAHILQCLWVSGLMLLFVYNPSLNADEQRTSLLENEIRNLQSRRQQLELEREALTRESEMLAERIEELKKKIGEGIGIIGGYRLRRSLKQSQELAERIETIQTEIDSLKLVLDDKKRDLRVEYEAEISNLLTELDKSPPIEEATRLLERLSKLITAKRAVEEAAGQIRIKEAGVEGIQIEKGDTPEQIREKADLISDFVDKLKKEISRIDRRIERLRMEKKTGEKMREFMEELALFDENMLRTAGLRIEDKRALLQKERYMEQELAWGLKDREKVSQKISSERVPELSGSGWEATVKEIEREVGRLEQEKRRLAREATELLKKAQSFYRKAAEISRPEGKTGGR